MLRDNSCVEHLHHQLKLRNSREALVSLRKDMIESNNRANFQGEVDKNQKRTAKTKSTVFHKRIIGAKITRIQELI